MQIQRITAWIICTAILSACTTKVVPVNKAANIPPLQDVLGTFIVEVPYPLQGDTNLALEWVNPLMAINHNSERLLMEKIDNLHYKLEVPLKKGDLLQYRYVKTGENSAIETGPDGLQVKSRYYFINSHSRIADEIYGFDLNILKSPMGLIRGTIRVQGTNESAPEILINVSGISTISSIDGSFQLQNIPAGTHNLTIFSPAGLFEPIQQQAVVEENTMTPVEVELTKKKLVNVSFIVSVPPETPANSVLRLFGSLQTLGNSSEDLFGGTNFVQSNVPILTKQSANEYVLVLALPGGTKIQYCYSLGDLSWNRELDSNDNPVIRTIYIPNQDAIFEDQILKWQLLENNPITLRLNSPSNTQLNDEIQVEFNQSGWSNPMKMWRTGDGRFEFSVYSPLNISEPIQYRFCRSSICGTENLSNGAENHFSFQWNDEPQVIDTTNVLWEHLSIRTQPTIVSTDVIQPRGSGFTTAIELSDRFQPGWTSYLPDALDSVLNLNAGTIIIPYSWTFLSANPVWLAPKPGLNPTISTIQNAIIDAHKKGLRVYIHATLQYDFSSDEFWKNIKNSPENWLLFNEAVTDFYNQTTLLANSLGAEGLILGDEQTSQIMALKVSAEQTEELNKSTSFSISDLIEAIAKIENGSKVPIFLAWRYDDLISLDAGLLEGLDGIYLLDLGSFQDLRFDNPETARNLIKTRLEHPMFIEMENNETNLWVGLDFPSVQYDSEICITYPSQCENTSIFDFPLPMQPDLQISMENQTNLYNAAMSEINSRPWIMGVSSRRYLIPGAYQDQSASIRGKPAADVIWYWFSKICGIPIE